MKTSNNELRNFANKPGKILIVLGDSFSWGAGLSEFTENSIPYEYLKIKEYDSWPYHMQNNYGGFISKTLGLDYVNYSVPGCSNDTIHRNFMYLLENHSDWLEQAFILIGWTANHRYEISSPDLRRKYRNMSPNWDKKFSPTAWVRKYHNLYNSHIYSPSADDLRSYNNIVSVSTILSYHKIPNLQYWALQQFQEDFNIQQRLEKFKSFNFDLNISSMCFYDIPEDDILPCKHPNANGHKIIADKILNSFE